MKAILVAMLLGCSIANAKIMTKTVEYKDGDQILEGYLAFETKGPKRKPLVLVTHAWMGLNDYVRSRSEQLAKEGYVAFAVDIYGKGIRPDNPKDAGALAGKYKGDRELLRRRIKLGLEAGLQQPQVDTSKVAAIGYCFGGTTVLELVRTGADIDGVVSFHGGLSTPMPAKEKFPARVLVLHGADDPNVPPKEVDAFESEMKAVKADWELTKYSGAVHSFTEPGAGNDPSKGAAYNETADKRSWIAMQTFLKEIFR